MHLSTCETKPLSDAHTNARGRARTHTHTHARARASTENPKAIIKNINTIIQKQHDSNSDTGSYSCFTAKNKSYH